MATKEVVVTIARIDGGEFAQREAWIETDRLKFNRNDTAKRRVPGRKEPYYLSWIVRGEPGEYTVQITAPEEAVNNDANSRRRRISADGFGAGQRRFKVNP